MEKLKKRIIKKAMLCLTGINTTSLRKDDVIVADTISKLCESLQAIRNIETSLSFEKSISEKEEEEK